MKSAHSGRLERWLGVPMIELLSRQMKGWYGPPIHLLDVPGSVRACGDGDFIGPFERGYFASAADSMREFTKRLAQGRVSYGQVGVGFASVADYLSRRRQGYTQDVRWVKTQAGLVALSAWSLWAVAGSWPAGAAGSAAPGGRAPTLATTGAMPLRNPASGTMHLTGFDVGHQISGIESVLLYDRIFDVAKTMSSTGTETVTGVPTRYQSQVATDPDYIGGNFLFPEVITTLSATAHNWTVCTYLDQANAASTLPSSVGISGAVAQRIDIPLNTWFMPLASGDVGVKALTQMQCSASVTGAVTFAIGHPIGFAGTILTNMLFPFDWITNRSLAPRIFNDACLATMRPACSSNSLTSGIIEVTEAAA